MRRTKVRERAIRLDKVTATTFDPGQTGGEFLLILRGVRQPEGNKAKKPTRAKRREGRA